MVRLPLRVGEMQSVQKFYVTPNLCEEVILDWLHHHRARIKFNPTVLVVNDTRLLLKRPHDRYITVVTEEDIKLP